MRPSVHRIGCQGRVGVWDGDEDDGHGAGANCNYTGGGDSGGKEGSLRRCKDKVDAAAGHSP